MIKKGEFSFSEGMKIIKNYCFEGMSCAEVAKKCRRDKSSIKSFLSYWGQIREALGVGIENAVYEMLLQKGKKAKHMRGDNSYDILINDKIRVDVKSASRSKDGRYRFQLQSDERATVKDLYAAVDEFYLVPTDVLDKPVFRFPVSEVAQYQKAKAMTDEQLLRLNLVGYLGGGDNL